LVPLTQFSAIEFVLYALCVLLFKPVRIRVIRAIRGSNHPIPLSQELAEDAERAPRRLTREREKSASCLLSPAAASGALRVP